MEGFPSDDLRKILLECHWMAKVPNGVETLPENFNRVGCTSVTDRQTTDGRATAYSEFTFAKNYAVIASNILLR